MDRARELGEFLRHRRSRLTPEAAGITARGTRRTTGLRREEVSALSGVGATWYTRLEQGRADNVSVDVLDALARVLQLTPAERTHLAGLAGHPAPPSPTPATPPPIDRLLAALEPAPAFAMDHQWDIVAWNAAHGDQLVDLGAVAPPDRNLLVLVFTNPQVRTLMADWDTEARVLVGEYRIDLTPHRDSPAHQARVARLIEANDDFRRWWDDHHVATFQPRTRHFDHPARGRFSLEHQRLQLASEPSIRIVAYLPTAEHGAAADDLV